jgi:hypothetical protein
MKLLFALMLLGSISTSASAAGSDIRGLVDYQTGQTVVREQQSNPNRPPIGRAFSHYRYFGRGAAGLAHWQD